jgi:hypothetical protein
LALKFRRLLGSAAGCLDELDPPTPPASSDRPRPILYNADNLDALGIVAKLDAAAKRMKPLADRVGELLDNWKRSSSSFAA